jgi:hypothetical protein
MNFRYPNVQQNFGPQISNISLYPEPRHLPPAQRWCEGPRFQEEEDEAPRPRKQKRTKAQKKKDLEAALAYILSKPKESPSVTPKEEPTKVETTLATVQPAVNKRYRTLRIPSPSLPA